MAEGNNFYKPLTNSMIEMLMDCHERELLKQPPSNSYFTRTAKGLISRGMFVAEMYRKNPESKQYLAFKLTGRGKDYLKHYL